MSFAPFHKAFAIAKASEADHTVTGPCCSEAVDADNEVCSYREQVQQYLLWSGSQLAATTAAGIGPSKGNVRVQHDPQRLGGVVTDIEYRDSPREIWLTTKVLPDVWPLVESAALTSYSQAGQYLRRWHEPCGTDIPRGNDCPTCGLSDVPIHYYAKLAEVSLCDRGSNPDATIRYIKSNGVCELRKARRYEGRQHMDDHEKRHHRIWLVEHLHDAHDKCEECDVPEHVKAHIAKARDAAQEWLYGEYPDMAVHGSEPAHGSTPDKVFHPAFAAALPPPPTAWEWADLGDGWNDDLVLVPRMGGSVDDSHGFEHLVGMEPATTAAPAMVTTDSSDDDLGF